MTEIGCCVCPLWVGLQVGPTTSCRVSASCLKVISGKVEILALPARGKHGFIGSVTILSKDRTPFHVHRHGATSELHFCHRRRPFTGSFKQCKATVGRFAQYLSALKCPSLPCFMPCLFPQMSSSNVDVAVPAIELQ